MTAAALSGLSELMCDVERALWVPLPDTLAAARSAMISAVVSANPSCRREAGGI